jgi:deoxyribonuclease-4
MNRVREILRDPMIRSRLTRLIPKDARSSGSDLKGTKTAYPQTMIKLFPDGYSDFGLITEHLLREPVIDDDALVQIVMDVTEIELENKTVKLMSTQRYLEDVRETQRHLRDVLNGEEPVYDVELESGRVQGHPDIISDTIVFEVKTSSKAATEWNSYLIQAFSYVALARANGLETRTVAVVLPLQRTVWYWDVTEWDHTPYATELEAADPPSVEDRMFGLQVIDQGGVGPSINKEKGSVVRTLMAQAHHGRPFQFFLNGNLGADLKITEDQIRECRAYTLENPGVRAYCHLPYTLNLSNGLEDNDGFVLRGFTSYIKAIAEMGFRGGVIHVGKANNYPVDRALENMRHHILEVMTYATPECPILLETPAGQGNELLTDYESFVDFIKEIDDDRLGLCVDTCHVFSAGISPSEYMRRVFEDENVSRRLRLIHFTDSRREKGSCVDRHAMVGTGCIPKEEFLDVVYYAKLIGVDLILE